MGAVRNNRCKFMAAIFLVAVALVTGGSVVDATSHWQLVGTHPDAAAQPTSRGRTLHELQGFQGRVYAGYGDYGDNTGPINHRPWNPSTGQWELEGQQDTEEVNNYQVVNGILFSPSIDPAWRGNLELSSNASDYANLNGNRQWPDSDRFQSYHVFDFRKFASSEIASGSASGCSVSCATIWRTDNGGASWYQWFRDPADASGVYGGHRCYHLATYGQRAWANCTSGHKTWTGWSWVADTTQQYGHKEATTFAGTLVTPARGALRGFNGSERVLRSGTHRFVAVDGPQLVVVDINNRISATTDLSSWSSVGTLPSSATSFTAMSGRLYYGDSSSRLYAMGQSSTSPTTSTTSPNFTTSTTTTTTAPTTTTTTTAPTGPTATTPTRSCFLGLLCTG